MFVRTLVLALGRGASRGQIAVASAAIVAVGIAAVALAPLRG